MIQLKFRTQIGWCSDVDYSCTEKASPTRVEFGTAIADKVWVVPVRDCSASLCWTLL